MDKETEYNGMLFPMLCPNDALMECYFLSKPVDEEGKPVRGYRRRLHNIWKERYGIEITEQCLCDQARVIRRNEWVTKLELKNIRRGYFKEKKRYGNKQ